MLISVHTFTFLLLCLSMYLVVCIRAVCVIFSVSVPCKNFWSLRTSVLSPSLLAPKYYFEWYVFSNKTVRTHNRSQELALETNSSWKDSDAFKFQENSNEIHCDISKQLFEEERRRNSIAIWIQDLCHCNQTLNNTICSEIKFSSRLKC